jgi:hypothetical protein
MLQGGAGSFGLLPMLFGILGLLFGWRTAPLFVLVVLAAAVLNPLERIVFYHFRSSPAADAVLAAGVLAYVMAQHRLFGLRLAILPEDPRQGRKAPKPPPAPKRPSAVVPDGEAFLALVPVALAVAAAFGLWTAARWVTVPLDIVPRAWALTVVVWGVGGTLLAATAAIGYLGLCRQSRDEANLFLTDVLWAATRREQRRINRWRAWAKLQREK